MSAVLNHFPAVPTCYNRKWFVDLNFEINKYIQVFGGDLHLFISVLISYLTYEKADINRGS